MAKTTQNNPEYDENQPDREQIKICVPAAKIDEMLVEALDALDQARQLHENTANPETKRQVKRIVASLHSSLIQLAPLGVHSVSRLQRVPTVP